MTYPTAKIETSAGIFEVELWNDVAPKHCENFMKLAKEGFYDGLAFHRVIQDFVIQGGCPNTREGASGMPGTGGPGWTVEAEFNEKEHHEGVFDGTEPRPQQCRKPVLCVPRAKPLPALGPSVHRIWLCDFWYRIGPRNRDL